MRNNITKAAVIAVAIGAASLSMPAIAQDESEEEINEGPGAITVSGGVAVVSDYRFRGVSLTNKDFAVQPALTVSHESGLYVGAWGSNVAPNGGDDAEVDLFAGFSGGDGVTYDVGATYYLYPGASGFNYVELAGKLGTTIGPAQLGATVAYVPSQNNTGNQDNIYIAGNLGVGIPGTPVSLSASLGLEDGAFGNYKVDWSFGATAEVEGFTLGASYVDTSRFIGGLGKAGVVFSVAYNF